jgi:transcriptional antiterminator
MKLNDLLNKPTSSVAELAKKYKVSTDSVEKQLAQGIKVEMEHTRLRSVAREIALDHLGEDLNYYKKLSKLEKKPAQEALLIELFALLNEVKIDNVSGIGEVPDNKNVDYLGLSPVYL